MSDNFGPARVWAHERHGCVVRYGWAVTNIDQERERTSIEEATDADLDIDNELDEQPVARCGL